MTNEGTDQSFYDRHHRAFALMLVAISLVAVQVIVVISAGSTPSTASQVTLAVLPNLIAVPIVSVVLLVVLGRSASTTISTVDAPGPEFFDELVTRLKPSASASNSLRTRDELPKLRELVSGAKSVSVAAISGSGLSSTFHGVWAQCLTAGTDINVVLLNPRATGAVAEWDRLSNPPMVHPTDDILRSLRQFVSLRKVQGRGRFELLVTETLMPYSLILFEYEDGHVAQVEFHALHISPDDRPNVLLGTHDSPHWTAFFRKQFEAIWSGAEPPADELLKS